MLSCIKDVFAFIYFYSLHFKQYPDIYLKDTIAFLVAMIHPLKKVVNTFF